MEDHKKLESAYQEVKTDITDVNDSVEEQENTAQTIKLDPSFQVEDSAPVQDIPRRIVAGSKELFDSEILNRARRAGSRLKTHLSGKVVVEITDRSTKHLFDWSNDEPKVSLFEGQALLNQGEQKVEGKIDCLIKLKEAQLMAIQSGELNPQIALVNEKLKVEGNAGMAMYFFNLVYPPAAIV